ncbi:MAG: branched-chain amino acid ABC transporter permease [Desulfobacteraceae bacterium]|nr:branched-chain amino acid ABC transporter permease [Desulfobacteraceae bacterium]
MQTTAVKIGGICGLSGLLACLLGIVESFNRKFIIHEIVTMGQGLLLVIVFFFGYLAAKSAKDSRRIALCLNGVRCGAVYGAVLGTLVLTGQHINLRCVLINASPNLYDILLFSLEPYTGLTVLILACVVAGLVPGIILTLGVGWQRIIVRGFFGVMLAGVLQDLLRPMLLNGHLVILTQFSEILFPANNGLSIPAAFFFLILISGFQWVFDGPGDRMVRTVHHALAGSSATVKTVPGIVLILTLLLLPQFMNLYMCEVLTTIGLYVILGLGLNIVVGYAGLLDLGYVAFFAIGAYTMAILTSPEPGFFHLNFWQAIPFAVFLGITAGILLGIPVLNMQGDYLAIVTLGFGEILRILFLSDILKPYLNGAHGIGHIPSPVLGGWVIDEPRDLYYLILAGCLIAVTITHRLDHSRIARAWKAIREDEEVAQAMGIDIVSAKLQAFAVGAGFSAFSGAIFAVKIGSVFPVSFTLAVSINIMCLILVGGIGSMGGVFMGALIMIGLPEILREFAEFRQFFYGILLVTIMILKPDGLWPVKSGAGNITRADNRRHG